MLTGDQFEIQSHTTCDEQLDLELRALPRVPTIDGQLPNDGLDHVGKILTVIDATPVGAVHCGDFWHDYVCEVSDLEGGATLIRTCSLPETLIVLAGDQFGVLAQTTCDGQFDLVLVPLFDAALLEMLVNEVLALNLNQGIENSLIAMLAAVLRALEDMNQNTDVAACNAMQAFINVVQTQSGSKIPQSDADTLIDRAQLIIEMLDCNDG